MGEFSTFHFPYTVEKENDMVYSLQYAAFQKAVENPWKTAFPVFSGPRKRFRLRLALVRILVTPDPFLLIIASLQGFLSARRSIRRTWIETCRFSP